MKQILWFLLTLLSMNVAAQKPEVIRLWSDVSLTKGETDPTITIFRPTNPNGMAIIACPGGGYSHLAMEHEGTDMAPWMNSLGITYVVLTYRMPGGRSEVPLKDAEQAIRLVRKSAAEWGVDLHRVGVMGSSAGGHLASTLATHYSNMETRPDFQILFYPVITMNEKTTHGGSRQNLIGKNPSEEMIRKFSNELQVTKDTPPAFLMLSSDDKAVPPVNGVSYYMALQQNGVQASLHIYPIGGHGWGFRDSFSYKRQWTGELERWLRNY